MLLFGDIRCYMLTSGELLFQNSYYSYNVSFSYKVSFPDLAKI